ncbi:unnamed protein product, partial [Musa acuminata subsp. burmannicoides]
MKLPAIFSLGSLLGSLAQQSGGVCPAWQCCSQHGYCANTSDYCGTAAPVARASATVAPAVVTPTRRADRRQRERCAPTGSAAASTATAEPRRTTAVPAARANAPTHSFYLKTLMLYQFQMDQKVSLRKFSCHAG